MGDPIAVLRDAAKAVVEQGNPEPDDADDLADAVREAEAIREVVDWLRAWLRDRDLLLGDLLGKDGMLVEGVGLVQGQWTTPGYEYDTEGLLHAVANVARDQRQVSRDGEVESEAEAVLRTLIGCFRVEPRRTDVKKLGINLDEWSAAKGDGYRKLRVVARQGTPKTVDES